MEHNVQKQYRFGTFVGFRNLIAAKWYSHSKRLAELNEFKIKDGFSRN